jgi:hypothetical protein
LDFLAGFLAGALALGAAFAAAFGLGLSSSSLSSEEDCNNNAMSLSVVDSAHLFGFGFCLLRGFLGRSLSLCGSIGSTAVLQRQHPYLGSSLLGSRLFSR